MTFQESTNNPLQSVASLSTDTPSSLARRHRLSCPVPPLASHLEHCAQMSDATLWPHLLPLAIQVPHLYSGFHSRQSVLHPLFSLQSISFPKAISIRANH